MNGQPPNDELLIMVFMLVWACLVLYWVIDRWSDSTFTEVWRTMREDCRINREERRRERRERQDVDRRPNLVIRIRDQWETKR